MRARLALVLVLLAVAAAAGSGSMVAAGTANPVLFVDTYNQTRGQASGIELDLLNLSTRTLESVAVTVPAGYALMDPPAGEAAGDVYIAAQPVAGGDIAELEGHALPQPPDALASQLAACAPGRHAAVWEAELSGPASVSLPIAVDKLATGGSYKLTFCLDPLKAAGLVPEELDLAPAAVLIFKNPAAAGTYVWDALATPFDAAGAPDPARAYELRANEPLPQTLTIHPTYSSKAHVMTVGGRLTANGSPRGGIVIHVFGGPNGSTQNEIGSATTTRTGSWIFHRKTSKPPVVASAGVQFSVAPCQGTPTAPGGCMNESTDGTFSEIVLVPQPKAKPRKKH